MAAGTPIRTRKAAGQTPARPPIPPAARSARRARTGGGEIVDAGRPREASLLVNPQDVIGAPLAGAVDAEAFPDNGDSASPLIRTKLAPPRVGAGRLARERLVGDLDAGRDRRLTLIIGPAGSGKTTLAALWRRSLAERGCDVAWYNVGEDDDRIAVGRLPPRGPRAMRDRSAAVSVQRARRHRVRRHPALRRDAGQRPLRSPAADLPVHRRSPVCAAAARLRIARWPAGARPRQFSRRHRRAQPAAACARRVAGQGPGHADRFRAAALHRRRAGAIPRCARDRRAEREARAQPADADRWLGGRTAIGRLFAAQGAQPRRLFLPLEPGADAGRGAQPVRLSERRCRHRADRAAGRGAGAYRCLPPVHRRSVRARLGRSPRRTCARRTRKRRPVRAADRVRRRGAVVPLSQDLRALPGRTP